MSEPEIEHLRKSVEELREKLYERDHENAREMGYSKGWQSRVEAQLDRIETRLDNLIFARVEKSPHKATAGIRREAAVAALPIQPAPPPGQ